MENNGDICTSCKNRRLCRDLCPEALMYANQDWGYLQELRIGSPEYSENDWPEGADEEKDLLTKTELKILRLLFDGKSRKEIAEVLDITRKDLRDRISDIRRKSRKIP